MKKLSIVLFVALLASCMQQQPPQAPKPQPRNFYLIVDIINRTDRYTNSDNRDNNPPGYGFDYKVGIYSNGEFVMRFDYYSNGYLRPGDTLDLYPTARPFVTEQPPGKSVVIHPPVIDTTLPRTNGTQNTK